MYRGTLANELFLQVKSITDPTLYVLSLKLDKFVFSAPQEQLKTLIYLKLNPATEILISSAFLFLKYGNNDYLSPK